MTTLPLITIVTPSFNQAQFLERTIQSILHQDYPYIEYIVIDGGSTDGSVDIINKYEKDLAYWVSEPDTGQSNAINKGFAKATGAIFAWLNSDDLLSPSAVSIAAHYLSKESNIDLVYGDRLHIDPKGNIIGMRQLPAHDPAMFRKNFTLPQETVFFRRALFETVGMLDETLHFSMDFDLWCKMSKVAHMLHIPSFMGYFREHETAKSVVVNRVTESDSLRYLEEHKAVFCKHFGTSPPPSAMMNWYRMLRRFTLLVEQRSKAYKKEANEIRSLMSMKTQV